MASNETSLQISYTRMAASEPRKYIGVREWYFSSPAVSHRCSWMYADGFMWSLSLSLSLSEGLGDVDIVFVKKLAPEWHMVVYLE